MTVPLGNPFALGAGPTVLTSARTDRLALGASFLPGAAPLAARPGFLYGPPGTMGDLTLLTDVLLRVAPFLAVVQGTHATDQGQYIVPNETTRDLAVPAKDAAQFRRALIVVRVADSFAAGVATSAATDGSWLEILPGPLAASNPALPATPANALLAGELSIPSTASGQPVTLTRYNPRTVARGGILPVVAGDVTAPAYDELYRSHPTLGLQRGLAGAWTTPNPSPTGPWMLFPLVGDPWLGNVLVTSVSTGSPPYSNVQYRREGDRMVMRGWARSVNGIPAAANGSSPVTTAAGVPAEYRPAYPTTLWPATDNPPTGAGSGVLRIELGPNGQMNAVRALAAGGYLNFDQVSWPIG